jgi:PEP-CTERM motif
MHLRSMVLLSLGAAAIFAAPAVHATITPGVCPDSASVRDYLNMSGGCTIGDKIFSDFSYSSAAQGGATAISASGVTVVPITTAFDPGLQFEANWSASSGQVSDSSIGFTVTVMGGAALIEDASIVQLGGSVVGTGIANVGEGLCVGFNCLNTTFTLNTVNTTDISLIQLGDFRLFSPTGQVRATKDIGVAGNANGFASVSLMSDQFSETQTPEPGTMTLFGTGLLGCIAILRRRLAGKRFVV